jgi:hypothetical protein
MANSTSDAPLADSVVPRLLDARALSRAIAKALTASYRPSEALR